MQTAPSSFAPLPEDGFVPPADGFAFTPLPLEQIRYASFSKRLFAYFMDNLLIAAFTCLVTAATLGDTMTALADYDKLVFVAGLVYGLNTAAFIGYFTITTGASGLTMGKYLMGVQVTCDGGGQVGYAKAFVRSLGYFVSGFALYLGFLFALFSKKSQTFHDLISGTVVLEKN
jgi:uncharacterized RDD family membrane protein YckC